MVLSLYSKRSFASEVLCVTSKQRFWLRENWGHSKETKGMGRGWGSKGMLASKCAAPQITQQMSGKFTPMYKAVVDTAIHLRPFPFKEDRIRSFLACKVFEWKILKKKQFSVNLVSCHMHKHLTCTADNLQTLAISFMVLQNIIVLRVSFPCSLTMSMSH